MVNKNNTINILTITFSGVGLLLLTISSYITFETMSFINNAQQVSGTVIRHDGTDTVDSIIEYQVKDKTYTTRSNVSSSPPAHKIGEQVPILFPVDSPGSGKLASFFDLWFVSILLGFMGLIFGGIGFGIIAFSIRRKKIIEQLKTSGTRLETDFQSVEKNTSIAVNGKNPYQIVSHYHDQSANKVHIFKSDNLWFNPTDYILDKKIMVLVDPNNYQKYYVDTSFLPTQS